MKEKILLDDIKDKSLEHLTELADKIIKKIEANKNLEDSLDEYQKLIKLNNIIEKKFQKKSKEISENTKQRINSITKKNEKKINKSS
tara:strand:- start:235 stop:495 length:261 start_codon:yes stop_codon:yes gene_type:complete